MVFEIMTPCVLVPEAAIHVCEDGLQAEMSHPLLCPFMTSQTNTVCMDFPFSHNMLSAISGAHIPEQSEATRNGRVDVHHGMGGARALHASSSFMGSACLI